MQLTNASGVKSPFDMVKKHGKVSDLTKNYNSLSLGSTKNYVKAIGTGRS
jgi:hypothetical protein